VGVVVASGGYPGRYATGRAIHGLDELPEDDVIVFHAGTRVDPEVGGKVVTSGGRVLTVTAVGSSLDEARRKAYAGVGRVRFDDAFYRTDIAALD
jgi:phosphoribosylamine--glycine ligase